MKHKLIAALACLTLVACGNALAPPGEDLSGTSQAELKASPAAGVSKAPHRVLQTSQLVRPQLWTTQVSDSATDPTFKTTFAIDNTYDLFIAFDIPVALAGQHIAAFEVVSPSGTVYQRTEVPFSSGTSTLYRVWSSMPVAGTWIQQFAMAGSWSVRVFLDDEQASRASRTFILQ